MAYVITAVGAGGKTSFLKQKAAQYLREGSSVLLVTTTHIWGPQGSGWTRTALTDEEGQEQAFLWEKEGEADLAGTLQPDGKLSALPPAVFRNLCESYDFVLVEGDGSHCMPVKIPSEREPVVPENTDEIAVVMGRHALGRKLQAVCQRFDPDRLRTLG